MTLPTNKAKRDAILSERVAAIGGRLVEADSSKYGSDLTSYYLYITFDNDPGPLVEYRNGKRLDESYNAYRIIIKGGIDRLDSVTSNPQHLAIHVYRERRDHHWKMRKLDDLQRDLDYARKTYERTAGETMIATIRGTLTAQDTARNNTDEKRLREAVEAFDEEYNAMIAVIGEYPRADDDYYPMF